MLSYVIDVYRGTLRPASLLDFAVYVAFFPYLAAGPIARASEFLPQLDGPRDPRRVDTSRAFFLIFGGLVKKMLIADYLATHIVNGVFTTPGQYSSLEVLVGIIGYSVQIYCDFSAYADIAIGISLLLGFELPDNFNAPYTAASVQDFWRRWHMTLSRWLRDYLYIPLGGNRRGRSRTYVNLMLTMVLGGLWHGAGWTFIFWGFLYGGALIVEHARVDRRKDRALVIQHQRLQLAEAFEGISRAAPLPEGPGAATAKVAASPLEYDRRPWHGAVWPRIGVFAFVTFAWIFFRSDTFGAAVSVIARLFQSWGSIGTAVTPGVFLAIAVGIGVQYVPRSIWQRAEAGFSVLNPILQGVILAFGLHAARRPRPGRPRGLPLLQVLMAEERTPRDERRPDGATRQPQDGSRDDRLPFGRRRRTAASALVAMVIAMALGALLNAPAMKKTALEMPFGAARSFHLALVDPLASVSHWLLLDRPAKVTAARPRQAGPGPDRRRRSSWSSPRRPRAASRARTASREACRRTGRCPSRSKVIRCTCTSPATP